MGVTGTLAGGILYASRMTVDTGDGARTLGWVNTLTKTLSLPPGPPVGASITTFYSTVVTTLTVRPLYLPTNAAHRVQRRHASHTDIDKKVCKALGSQYFQHGQSSLIRYQIFALGAQWGPPEGKHQGKRVRGGGQGLLVPGPLL